jgi:hypothetical protein
VIKREAMAFDESYAGTPHRAHFPSAQLARKNLTPVVPIQRTSGTCLGAQALAWGRDPPVDSREAQPSSLQQWPVQLHLVHPTAPFWNGKELLIAADCVSFAMGAFHRELLSGRSLAIACPKLDDPSGYLDKLTAILAENDVKAVRVAIMEVPCCGGLAQLALRAIAQAQFKNDVELLVVSRHGEVIQQRLVQRVRGTAEAHG